MRRRWIILSPFSGERIRRMRCFCLRLHIGRSGLYPSSVTALCRDSFPSRGSLCGRAMLAPTLPPSLRRRLRLWQSVLCYCQTDSHVGLCPPRNDGWEYLLMVCRGRPQENIQVLGCFPMTCPRRGRWVGLSQLEISSSMQPMQQQHYQILRPE